MCKSLRGNYGLSSALFVNNEITLILLALRNYFKPEVTSTQCPLTAGVITRQAFNHNAIESAADLSFAVGWLKIIDKVEDEGTWASHRMEKHFKSRAQKAAGRLDNEFLTNLGEYKELVTTNNQNIEDLRSQSRLLACGIFQSVAVHTNLDAEGKELLTEVFGLVGELLPVIDALVDLQTDLKKGMENPIVASANNLGCPWNLPDKDLRMTFMT